MSFDLIKAIVDARDFPALIGRIEDLWLDVKQKPGYDFSTPVGRFELAKDVTAFANAEGGFILVGFKTDKPANENLEVINEIEPCTVQEFNAAQYIGIIKEHTYPKIENLNIQWVPTAQPDLGIGIIEIPPQAAEKKYFLTTKVVENGVPLTQVFFGIAKRTNSDNDSFSAQQIYEITQKGKSPVAETLTRIEDKINSILQNGTAAAAAVDTPASKVQERIDDLLDE